MKENPLIIATGAIPSPKDVRDFQLGIVAMSSLPAELPRAAGTVIDQLPVWMQNKIGACVGHAWAKSQQKCELSETAKLVSLSPRFLYAVAKCLDGYEDEGTYPRLVGEILRKYGCATEDTVPNNTLLDHEQYVYYRDMNKIPANAFREASKYGIDGYAFSPSNEQGIKQAIYYSMIKNQGVVMLMRVGNTFYTAEDGEITWDARKILPIRRPKVIESGHEVFPYWYEYDDTNRLRVYFLNSWSGAWADNGKGWFYWDEWQDLIDEILTSIDRSDVPGKTFQADLRLGNTGADVLALQKALNGKLECPVTYSGPGSVGHETDFFGSLTLQAVKKFQGMHGLPQTGFFGPLSRQVANTIIK